MSALVSLSDCINLATGGGAAQPQLINFFRDARVGAAAAVATIAGRLTSLWQYTGYPSDGAVPAGVAAPTNALAGALKQSDPTGGRQLWLVGCTPSPLVQGTLILYDRLLHIGGLNGTTLTAQAVGGALTRYTNGFGNQIWVEIYTQIGASSTTITASYTNTTPAGATSQATAIGNTNFREAQRIIILPLAQGDVGVTAVTSVTLAATTSTAGNFGVTVAHPLLEIPMAILGVGTVRDCIAQIPAPIEIVAGACLAWAWLPNGTTAPQIRGQAVFLEK